MPDATLINATFGPFVLRELISAGGIAEVYRAQHSDDQRPVAVKIMRPDKQADKFHFKAFQDEFVFLQRLRHAGLPVARRQGEIKGRACFAMDFISGLPLHRACTDDKEWNRIAALVELISIVAYLHDEAVIHADLKLENVILRPTGNLVLVDFGNARVAQPKGFFARLFGAKDRVFGTPTYLAPELMKGSLPSFASDIYSLGVCAFIMLSGEPPFNASSRTGRLTANLKNEAPSIRSRCTELPLSAAKAIDSCLAKDPSDRPADAGHLLGALKELAAAKNVSTTKFIRKASKV